MISLTNHDSSIFQWGRSGVVIICPDERYVYSPSDSIFLQVVDAIWKVDGYRMPKTA